MLKCPNCGRKAEITKQWGCRWCSYPLVSGAFAREKERRDAEEARRVKREAAKARKDEAKAKRIEEAARTLNEPKQKTDQFAQEIEGKLKVEADKIIKRIVQQVEKETAEKQTTKPAPPQVKPFELPSRPSDVPEKIKATDRIRVFIVDRDLLSARGLDKCLSQSHHIEVVGRSDYYTEDTVSMIEDLAPNVVLMDIDLPSCSGLDLAQRIIERSHNISVILLTPYEDNEQIFGALKAGAAAYLSKHTPAEELASAIQRVHKGERIIDTLLIRPTVALQVLNRFHSAAQATQDLTISLSPHEMEILSYFANGYSRKQVAHAMTISDETIGSALARIISKLIAADSRREPLTR